MVVSSRVSAGSKGRKKPWPRVNAAKKMMGSARGCSGSGTGPILSRLHAIKVPQASNPQARLSQTWYLRYKGPRLRE